MSRSSLCCHTPPSVSQTLPPLAAGVPHLCGWGSRGAGPVSSLGSMHAMASFQVCGSAGRHASSRPDQAERVRLTRLPVPSQRCLGGAAGAVKPKGEPLQYGSSSAVAEPPAAPRRNCQCAAPPGPAAAANRRCHGPEAHCVLLLLLQGGSLPRRSGGRCLRRLAPAARPSWRPQLWRRRQPPQTPLPSRHT